MDDIEKLGVEECPAPRTYEERDTLLKKYDIPINHLDFDYVAKCTNAKELERILQILLSGEEGYFPQLLQKTEDRLAILKPTSRYIRKLTPVVDFKSLDSESKNDISDEMDAWIKNVHEQNAELDKHKKSNVTLHEIPEVRRTQCETETKENTKSVSRIKATDYASWDKYDPDTEILKMDMESEKLRAAVELPQSETKSDRKPQHGVKFAEFLTHAEATHEANREREKGNEYYKSGDYIQAITYYTNSINFLPSVNNYNNRAQAHMKIHKYKEAVADCTAALKYDENNVKANIRMAQSLDNLHLYQEALFFADITISLDPNNVIAQSLVNKIKAHLNVPRAPGTRMKIVEITEEKEKPVSNKPVTVKCQKNDRLIKGKPIKKSILKKNHYYRMPKLPVLLSIPGPSTMPEPYFIVVENKDPELIRRQQYILNHRPQVMFLSNVDDGDDDCIVIHNQHSKMQKETNEKHKIQEIKNTKENYHLIMNDKNSLNIKLPEVEEEVFTEPIEVKVVITNEVPTCDVSDNDLSQSNETEMTIQDEMVQHNITLNEPTNSNDDNNQNDNQQSSGGGGGEPHLDLNANIDQTPIEDIHQPYTFLKAWNSVLRDETYSQHAQILRNLDEQRLAQVIGYKLDGTMLTDILRTLYMHFTVPHEVERVHALITNIARLPRFNIVTMFLSAADKNKTKSLFEFLEQHGMPLPNDVKSLYL